MQSNRSFTFDEWTKLRRLSRTKAYALLRNGDGPRTYLVGLRRYVSADADREWLAKQEQKAAPLGRVINPRSQRASEPQEVRE